MERVQRRKDGSFKDMASAKTATDSFTSVSGLPVFAERLHALQVVFGANKLRDAGGPKT